MEGSWIPGGTLLSSFQVTSSYAVFIMAAANAASSNRSRLFKLRTGHVFRVELGLVSNHTLDLVLLLPFNSRV